MHITLYPYTGTMVCGIPIDKVYRNTRRRRKNLKLRYTAYQYYGIRYTAIPEENNSEITITVETELRYTVHTGPRYTGIPALTGIPS